MGKCPMGFHPSEQEKIAYLLQKANGKPSPSDDFISIPTIDIYGDKEPWEIFDSSEDKEIYFFSKLNKVWKLINIRNVGKGSWQVCDSKRSIFDSQNKEIGFLKRYSYRTNNNPDQDEKWLLEEYTLANEFKKCIKEDDNDYMFCSLKKNPKFFSDVQDKRTQNFFDQMLVEKFTASSSSASDNVPDAKSPSFGDWL